jgi:hypothetical protein
MSFFLENAAADWLLAKGGVENGFIVFQAQPAAVESLLTRRAPRRGVAC